MTDGSNRVRNFREKQGLTQVALAESAGITRQSLSAIESGRVDPSVSIALRLSRALDAPVEELFGDGPAPSAFEAELVTDADPAPGERVAMALVRDYWVAHPLGPETAGAADGLVLGAKKRGSSWHAEVEPLRSPAALRENFLVLGCAPALGLLVTRLNLTEGAGHFVWLDRPSTAARDAVLHAQAHMAGVHLPKSASRGASKLTHITLAHWDAGLVVPPGNPLGLRDVTDLARPGLRICARQSGAGTQALLEGLLRGQSLDPAQVLADARIALGHFAAARTVLLGAADVAVAMRGAALALGLDFVPLAEERFDLLVATESLSDPRMARALDLMRSASFKQELRALGGYDARDCGRVAT